MKKILIIRNDKLGDFMLAYPSYALARMNLPNTEIHALVPVYTKPLAKACSWIDKIIDDPGKDASWQKNRALLNQLKMEKYDAVITLFSTTRIGLLTKLAGIPYRLAPATKIAQVFYNHKLVQRRSRSEKPEYVYNMDLVSYFLKQQGLADIQQPVPPFLKFPDDEVAALRQNFMAQYGIPGDHRLIFLHPGSGGSASNLTPGQYAQLARNIIPKSGQTLVITAGPGELPIAQSVANELADIPHVIFDSQKGLLDFSKHIQFANLFISGSTGPLHIAGALNTPTVGFYPSRRSATALRWQTLNTNDRRLAFTPAENPEVKEMPIINLDDVAKQIKEFIKE